MEPIKWNQFKFKCSEITITDAIKYGRPADPTGLPNILVQFKWNQLSETNLNLNIQR